MTLDSLALEKISRNDRVYNFGAVPMPPGYAVVWFAGHEHYQAIGPDDWEGDTSVNPHWCRRQAIWHAKKREG